eukprot:4686611-Pleurochrysis_carterae.AAC.1
MAIVGTVAEEEGATEAERPVAYVADAESAHRFCPLKNTRTAGCSASCGGERTGARGWLWIDGWDSAARGADGLRRDAPAAARDTRVDGLAAEYGGGGGTGKRGGAVAAGVPAGIYRRLHRGGTGRPSAHPGGARGDHHRPGAHSGRLGPAGVARHQSIRARADRGAGASRAGASRGPDESRCGRPGDRVRAAGGASGRGAPMPAGQADAVADGSTGAAAGGDAGGRTQAQGGDARRPAMQPVPGLPGDEAAPKGGLRGVAREHGGGARMARRRARGGADCARGAGTTGVGGPPGRGGGHPHEKPWRGARAAAPLPKHERGEHAHVHHRRQRGGRSGG